MFVAAADGFAFVVVALAFGQGEFKFDLAFAKIEAQGDQGVAALVHFAVELFDFVVVHEQFAHAQRIVVVVVGERVGADVQLVDVKLPVFDSAVGVLEVGAALAKRFDFSAFEHHTGFEAVFDKVLVARLAVFSDDFNVILCHGLALPILMVAIVEQAAVCALNEPFDLVGGGHFEQFVGEPSGLVPVEHPDGVFDHRDGLGVGAQLLESHADQDRGVDAFAGHFAAHEDGDVVVLGRFGDVFEQAQYGRMDGVVQVGHVSVAAVDGHGVLDEVVGADAEEIDLFGDGVGHDGCRGHFDHDAHGDALLVGQSVVFQRLGGFGDQPFGFDDLLDMGDEGQQDAYLSVVGGAQDRAQLGAEHLGFLQAVADGAQAQYRVLFKFGNVGHGFVAVDVQGADGDRLVGDHLDHIFVVFEEFVFAGEVFTRQVLELGAIEADAIATPVAHGDYLFGQFDVAHDGEFQPVYCFGRQVAAAGVEGPALFERGFADLGLSQGLFAGVDHHDAGVAVDHDDIVVLDDPGGALQAEHGRDLQAAGDDAGVGGAPAAVGDEPHDPFKLDLAGVGRREVAGHEDDAFGDAADIDAFHSGQVLEDAV